ncbi:MAG: hypothetical protein C4335_07105, partial [Armatimonadota bacterium]
LTPAQVTALLQSVEQARSVFASEATRFVNSAQIDHSLRKAIRFLRSAAALLNTGNASSAKNHVKSAATRLKRAYDLMQRTR